MYNPQAPTHVLVIPRAHARDVHEIDVEMSIMRFDPAGDPTGSGRTVIRGGYGLYIDQSFLNVQLNVAAASRSTCEAVRNLCSTCGTRGRVTLLHGDSTMSRSTERAVRWRHPNS